MPPRPRPQPRAKAISVSSRSPSPSEASTPSARRKRAKKEEDEEDEMFVRNKGRSLKEVNQRAARAAAVALQASTSTAGSDEEDEDEEETPKQGLAKKRKLNTFNAKKGNALPKWAKKGAIRTLLEGSDSDSENNHPSTYEGTPSKRRRHGASGSNTGTPMGKRGKRARSRSRSQSLTPPPDLTEAEKLRTQQAIQHALSSEHEDIRPSSPDVELDDDGDDVGDAALDPELQAIRDRASKYKAVDDYGSTQQTRPRMAHHNSSGGPPNVSVRVKWVAHPEDDVMRGRPQETWSFTVKRHQSLKELFLKTADKAHVLAEDLVLMRDGKQVFTSVSPEGLGVWDQVDLDACDRTTFEALRSRHFRSPTPAQYDTNNDSDSDGETSAPPSEASVEPGDADKFKLVLRAPGTKDVTLSVRPTTTCGKIVRAFLAVVAKHGGTVPASPRKAVKVQLCIDGERQDPDTPIADCDLEDGDMVEVVGL